MVVASIRVDLNGAARSAGAAVTVTVPSRRTRAESAEDE
jgi:hypothetical protein